MCHDNLWVAYVPLVLLGMRTAFKEDFQATAAEMLNGENLRLPGELLASTTSPSTSENLSYFGIYILL